MIPTTYALLTGFVEFLAYIKPESILDIAVGNGKLGYIAREYLDMTVGGNRRREDWRLRLDGIESREAVIQDHQRSIYNDIHIGDAVEKIDGLGSYDVVVIGEWFAPPGKGHRRRMLEKCLAHANRAVIVLAVLDTIQTSQASPNNASGGYHAAWKTDELMGYCSRHVFYQTEVGKFGAFLIEKDDYIDKRIASLKDEAFVAEPLQENRSIRAKYDLDRARIGAVDLSPLADLITNDEYRGYFLDTAFREHYRLLAYLSTKFSGQTIFDVGTLKGYSALALSYNSDNNVISYDIEDLKEIKNRERLKTIDYRIGNVLEDPALPSSPLVLLDTYHEGRFEREFYAHLKAHRFKGLLVLDDIFLNQAMKTFWHDIDLPKEDITDLGHWSGTGIVDFG